MDNSAILNRLANTLERLEIIDIDQEIDIWYGLAYSDSSWTIETV